MVIEARSLSNPRLKRTVVEVSDEDEAFYQDLRDTLAQLPDTDDITILTLKGHLIIEQLLIQIIESAAVNAAPLKDLNRLQFSTRVALAESTITPPIRRDGGIWPLLRKLGKIRNDIAHQLTPKKLDEDIRAFVDLYIRFFGVRVVPPSDATNRHDITKDNYLIPQNVRKGTMSEKFRNALAGTAQGLVGTLAVIRDDARIRQAAVDKARDKATQKSSRKERHRAP